MTLNTLEPHDGTPPSPAKKWLARLAPILILALGVAGTALLIKSRRPPERKSRPKAARLVEVVIAQPEKRQVEVLANGVVRPWKEAAIIPEVSGRIRAMSPGLVVGGLVKKGEVLISIDPTDYKLAVKKASAQVAQARRALATVQSNAQIARAEWERLGKGSGASPSPLTLHEPQLEEAKAMLAAAEADAEMAKINLSRTTIRAPFNLRVRSEQAEVGQVVRAGQEVVRVYGTDIAEVVVPLPASELRWLDIPESYNGDGSAVTVRLKTGEGVYERQGKLVRTVGEVDSSGQMSKVVVAIVDPYNLSTAAERYQPAFEVGAFVEVALEGRELSQVVPIPAEALRRGSRVWVAGPGERLEIREVTTARVSAAEALVLTGLNAGDRVVLSNITGAVEGLQLRVQPTQGTNGLRQEARLP